MQAASGRRDFITVFGRDYDTDDGTCVRDYVHVNDLCSAHYLALLKLVNNDLIEFNAFNLGNGEGFSVQQVIDVVKNIVGEDGFNLVVNAGQRRAGDPAILVADASKAIKVLGWEPQFANLETIVKHAWRWEKTFL